MSKNKQTGLIALQAASAEILTASVSIKTLRVDSRQLTMGTFRQLPKRDLVDEGTVELLGTVWGWVNYNPDGNTRERQFVVQFGEELYRCPFYVRHVGDYEHAERWPIPLKKMDKNHRSLVYSFAIASLLEGRSLFTWAREYGHPAEVPSYSHADYPFPHVRVSFGYDSGKDSMFQLVRDAERPQEKRDYMPRENAVGWEIEKRDCDLRDGEWVHVIRSADQVQTAALSRIQELHANDIDSTRNAQFWAEQIRQNVANANRYIYHWNALMDRLDIVKQLYIAT